MSWWPIPDSPDDLTGDGPADAVGVILGDLARQRSEATVDKPTLAELAGALELLLRRAGLLPASSPGITVGGSSAATGLSEQGTSSDPTIRRAPADDLVQAVGATLTRIRTCYRRDLGREPRLSEVLYAFTFVLGARPEQLLSGSFPDVIEFAVG